VPQPVDLSIGSTIVATPGLLSTETGDEAVILELRDGTYFSVNDVGAFIWERIQEPLRVQALCDRIEAEFTVDRATCEDDVLSFLSQLASRGLIEVASGRNLP
jgi:hypothetical protein